ncbi:hypothetical protein Nmel_003147 [Mimus melanotis]
MSLLEICIKSSPSLLTKVPRCYFPISKKYC